MNGNHRDNNANKQQQQQQLLTTTTAAVVCRDRGVSKGPCIWRRQHGMTILRSYITYVHLRSPNLQLFSDVRQYSIYDIRSTIYDLRLRCFKNPERPNGINLTAFLFLWLRRPARPNLSKCGNHFNFLGFCRKPDRQSRRCLHQAGLFLTLLGSPEYLWREELRCRI